MAESNAPSTSSRRPKATTRPEVSIGSFIRQEEIGRGSFATVYRAKSRETAGFVAIKSVDVNRLNKKLKENLYSEIQILKGMHHPHIVALIDCKESSAHIHLIMEFCELGDLSYFIKKKDSLNLHDTMKETIKKYPNPPGGGLNEVIVRHFLKQLADAVEFLRSKNYIHRDVKPQNLLLNPSPYFYVASKLDTQPLKAHEGAFMPNVGVQSLPTLKLADFGFARSLPTTSLAETLCGSPLYMAPEILRYEKYDARVDLWSIGTVLYEMLVGKPPFKASNHVELLRKIEKGEDRILFPSEIHVSDSLKRLTRGLLKRHPSERMSFQDFFNNMVVKDEIPGLTPEDRELQLPRRVHQSTSANARDLRREGRSSDETLANTKTPGHTDGRSNSHTASRADSPIHRRSSGLPPRTPASDPRDGMQAAETDRALGKNMRGGPKRPSLVGHATAPAHAIPRHRSIEHAMANTLERRPSQRATAPRDPNPEEQRNVRDRERRERAAQDVAFERDYVVVEKRAVEVNAFADELAASPRFQGSNTDPNKGALVRRATHQGPLAMAKGASVTPSRAMQIASGNRPDPAHRRKSSYEKRLRDTTSATSAISKAINMASGRLFGMGFSPPLALGRGGGPSPPAYAPFPTYPVDHTGTLMLEDHPGKPSTPIDEGLRTVQVIEDNATRSDVVFSFAEVKYKQLIPLAPSMDNGIGLRITEDAGEADGDQEGLTVDAIVTLSEEALVLYVKALAILAKAMDIAGTWWRRRNRADAVEDTGQVNPATRTSNAMKIESRINNVVQWVRSRFNETLEKAEFVRLKLLEAQKQLPEDHPSHPNNHPSPQSSVSSAEQVIVTSGVTAERLIYDRALEMSRSAAVNELVGEDLPGCELAYITAVRMLEAVLEDDEEPSAKKAMKPDKRGDKTDLSDTDINGVGAEDRAVVVKMVHSIRSRLHALRKKMQVVPRQSSGGGGGGTYPAPAQPPQPTMLSKSPVTTSHPTVPSIATTPPR